MEALKSEVDALKADQKAHVCANKAFMKRIRACLLDERFRGSKKPLLDYKHLPIEVPGWYDVRLGTKQPTS